MDNNALNEWLRDAKHLPEFLRDFHAQKDIFRFIDSMVENQKYLNANNTLAMMTLEKMPDWITAHIYTIDYFLWVMGKFGYVLQKSTENVGFMDLDSSIAEFEKQQIENAARELRKAVTQ